MKSVDSPGEISKNPPSLYFLLFYEQNAEKSLSPPPHYGLSWLKLDLETKPFLPARKVK